MVSIDFWSLINWSFLVFLSLICDRLLYFNGQSTIIDPFFWRYSRVASFWFNFKVRNFSVYLQIQFDFFGLSWTISGVNVLWARSNFSLRFFNFLFLLSYSQMTLFLNSTDLWFFIHDRGSSDGWLINKAWCLSRKWFLLCGTDLCLDLVFSCY